MEETSKNAADSTSTDRECAICLEAMVQPTELPCKHVFCFLCVKGIAQQTRCCALCRRGIPLNYFDSPRLLHDPCADNPEKGKCSADDENKPLWYYNGRSGWWQYDDRTCGQLEEAHSKGATFCEVLIAGYLYVIDFVSMTQIRKDDPIRTRRVKRDTQPVQTRGIAGVPDPNAVPSFSPRKAPTHPSNSASARDINEAGPSCSVFVIQFNPDGPSTSAGSKTWNKNTRHTKFKETGKKTFSKDTIIISSDEDDGPFNYYYDSDDDDAFSDYDDFSDVDDDDDDSDSDDDSMDEESFLIIPNLSKKGTNWQKRCDTGAPSFAQANKKASKRKAPDEGPTGKIKKPLLLNSVDYQTARTLLKAEHTHAKESLKLKHTRSLVDKKKKGERIMQKKQNVVELRELEKKQNEEFRQFLKDHKEVNNLYCYPD